MDNFKSSSWAANFLSMLKFRPCRGLEKFG
jgi:hypothetical protein